MRGRIKNAALITAEKPQPLFSQMIFIGALPLGSKADLTLNSLTDGRLVTDDLLY